jgi:hypothetical protein
MKSQQIKDIYRYHILHFYARSSRALRLPCSNLCLHHVGSIIQPLSFRFGSPRSVYIVFIFFFFFFIFFFFYSVSVKFDPSNIETLQILLHRLYKLVCQLLNTTQRNNLKIYLLYYRCDINHIYCPLVYKVFIV